MRSFLQVRFLVLLTLTIEFCVTSMNGQVQAGRTSVSFNVSMAKYWGEFTSDLFGYGADVRLRYDLSKSFGIQLQSGVSTASYRVTRYDLSSYSDYYGGRTYGDFYPNSLTRIDSLNSTRFFHHEILGVMHCLPSKSFTPQIFIGFGIVNHHATVESDNTALVRGMNNRYTEWSAVFPVGLGFEYNISEDMSVGANAIARLSTSDNYDDVFVAESPNDYFATVSFGLTMYIDGELDTDGDGLPDREERRLGLMKDMPDSDGDLLSDYEELYVFHTNPRQADSDQDGLLDGEEKNLGSSPLRSDTDGDGIGDFEEKTRGINPTVSDSDRDGILDGDEVIRWKTNPAESDSDNDGLTDYEELRMGTDPLLSDSDHDGLEDGTEISEYQSDPLRSDTDGDGLSDAEEAKVSMSDPRNPDSDNDKIQDGEEVLRTKTNPNVQDTDFDGWNDGEEVVMRGTLPTNPDTDGDGIIDPRDSVPCGIRCATCSGGGDNHSINTSLEKSPTKRRMYSILFLKGSEKIDESDPETRQSIQELRKYLATSCEKVRVLIEGHTSAEGSRARNQILSEMRAEAVRNLLVQNGVSPIKISGTVGYGSSLPVVKEPSVEEAKNMPQGLLESIRRKNRRITLREEVSCD